MRRFLISAGLAFACLVLPASAIAQSQGAQAFSAVFGPCHGDTCVVRSNSGGEINKFLAAARAVRAGAKRLVVIDGPCYSACVLFADVARERVCITDRASFGFHKTRIVQSRPARGGGRHYREIGRSDPEHSRDIAGWVYRNGGYPSQGFRLMSARQAQQFWRQCRLRRG